MAYIEAYDVPQFFSTDVCKAASVDIATLKNWISRSDSVILMDDEDRASFLATIPESEERRSTIELRSYERKASGSGRPHLFTFRRLMQIALTAKLVAHGILPSRAGSIAAGFTDLGESAELWRDNQRSAAPRLPGQLYKDGMTILVYRPPHHVGKVVRISTVTPAIEVLVNPGGNGGTTALIVNSVLSEVLGALELHADWGRSWLTSPTSHSAK